MFKLQVQDKVSLNLKLLLSTTFLRHSLVVAMQQVVLCVNICLHFLLNARPSLSVSFILKQFNYVNYCITLQYEDFLKF